MGRGPGDIYQDPLAAMSRLPMGDLAVLNVDLAVLPFLEEARAGAASRVLPTTPTLCL